MRRVLVGILVAGLMVVMTASPGSACDVVTEIKTVYDDPDDQNKMYDALTFEPKCQWPDGSPVGSADFLDIEYVKLTRVTTDGFVTSITVEMGLYGPITADSELPAGVKEVGWVVGVYEEILHWHVDSYAVAVNWIGGAELKATWEDFTADPESPDPSRVDSLGQIDLTTGPLSVITVELTDTERMAEFESQPYWYFGIRIILNGENGEGRTLGFFWVDLTDWDVFPTPGGDMPYPW
jgi:hypothetical protein